MILRPYSPADAIAAHAAAVESYREVGPWMPWCTSDYTLETAKQWIALCEKSRHENTAFEFAVFDDRGEFIGGCGLNQFDPLNKRANLGYWMRTSATGHGHATEAVRMLVGWAKTNTDFQRIEILVAVGNVASLRVAEKSGAIREAVLKSRILLHGEFHDAVMHAFIRGLNF